MKTMIAIPCMDTIPYEFAQSILSLEKGDVSAYFRANSLVYDSRNIISLTAIEQGFDRIMWFDSDMIFIPNTLKMLHADMDQIGNDMVTGLYFKRCGKNDPVIYDRLEMPTEEEGSFTKQIHTYYDYPKDKLFPISGCGFGCVLTSVAMIKDVWDHFGPAFAPFTWAGEDIAFCYRARKLGYKIYCDSRVQCGHVGKHIFTEDDYIQNRGDAG